LNDNQISAFDDLRSIGNYALLSVLYLERNPVQLQNQSAYRRTVFSLLPGLTQLDADQKTAADMVEHSEVD